MYQMHIVFILMCAVAASASCISGKKKEEPKIHIIHLKSSNAEPNDPNIVEIHIPSDISNRRRRETKFVAPNIPCKTDKDCPQSNSCNSKIKQCAQQKLEKAPKTPNLKKIAATLPRSP